MPEENSKKKRPEDSSRDISPILKGWDYEPGTINVRKVAGLDGREKLQMRLDLGVLQMEMTGRPDGQRPHGYESYLDFVEEQLANYRNDRHTEEGFVLRDDQCMELREEALMYYHRYLSLFILGDYTAVVRDTARNLRVLDLCAEFGVDEHDRLILEQYRPYMIMMNTRASASLELNEKMFQKALTTVTDGLDRIREFFVRFGQQEAFDKSNEVKILKRFARDIRRKLPVDPVEKLQNKLERAIKREDYEEAARLRDEIQTRKRSREGSEK